MLEIELGPDSLARLSRDCRGICAIWSWRGPTDPGTWEICLLACLLFFSVGWAPASVLLTCDLRRGAGRHFSRAGAALGTPAVDWRVPFLLSILLRQRLVRWALKTTTAGAARTGSLLPPRGSPWGPYYFTVEAGAMLLVAGAATVATRISGLWSTGAWMQGGLASGDEGH